MTANEASRRSRIPAFTGREEEAEFWDTHDSADYDEFTPADVQFAGSLSDKVVISLEPKAMKALRARTAEEGIDDPTALVLTWTLERLGMLTDDMRATPGP
jgi:hypothetical protein